MSRQSNAALIGCTLLVSAASAAGPGGSETPRYFGEPVALQGRTIYFTSWKYVRQGSFTWRVQADPNASEAERQAVGAWLKGDGSRPAVFETFDMPRGVRLVAQSEQKVPFQEGQLAADVFDEGKYKAWYVISPCPEPEPFSSKDKILPGHNGHVAYAESVGGVTWTRPDLGLYEYAGNRSNNIVWRGDLNERRGVPHIDTISQFPCSMTEGIVCRHTGGGATLRLISNGGLQVSDFCPAPTRRDSSGGTSCLGTRSAGATRRGWWTRPVPAACRRCANRCIRIR
jgi:hypothetical protein